MPKASRRWTRQAAHVLDHRLAGSFMPASVDRRDMRVAGLCVCKVMVVVCALRGCLANVQTAEARRERVPDEANERG
jgi:hypothetical protein